MASSSQKAHKSSQTDPKKNSSRTSWLAEFPPEMIDLIISKLPPETRVSLMLCRKNFRQKTVDLEYKSVSASQADQLCTETRSYGVKNVQISFDKGLDKGHWCTLPDYVASHAVKSVMCKGQPLMNIAALAGATTLERLNLSWCEALEDIGPLANCRALVRLYLSGCPEIKDISALAFLTQLVRLDLSGCPGIHDISALAFLKQLKWLDLSRCYRFNHISPLAECIALETLDMSGCCRVNDISALAFLKELEWLDMSGCCRVNDISALAFLKELKWLDLSGCV